MTASRARVGSCEKVTTQTFFFLIMTNGGHYSEQKNGGERRLSTREKQPPVIRSTFCPQTCNINKFQSSPDKPATEKKKTYKVIEPRSKTHTKEMRVRGIMLCFTVCHREKIVRYTRVPPPGSPLWRDWLPSPLRRPFLCTPRAASQGHPNLRSLPLKNEWQQSPRIRNCLSRTQ